MAQSTSPVPTPVKNWLMSIAVAVTVSMMGWIGVSQLKSLTFQAAVQPQMESIAISLKETQLAITDIRITRTTFATKKQFWAEIKRLDQRIEEMQLEVVELKLKMGADQDKTN